MNIQKIIMPSIDLSEKVKEKLDKIKEDYGYKTFSEAVNILLLMHEEKKRMESK